MPLQAGAAACSGGGEAELACWFDQGLDLQERSDAAETPGEKRSLLEQAASAYESALAIEPDRGAVLNNLAGVYADLGRDAEAEDLFERAVAQEESRQPFYRCNFADFLRERGDRARAADQYRKALEEEPDFLRAHEGLTSLLSREAMPEYVRFLISRGQVLAAEEIVLARLREESTQEDLVLLIRSLAERPLSPDELIAEGPAEALRNLIGHPGLGEGAREVLLLRQGDDFDPASYAWWAERDPKVFRGLIRSFGEAHRRADQPGPARDYFQLAVTLTEREPDLEALRRMVDLPASAENRETIDLLAAWNEPLVRKEESRTERYLYRHALGLFYAFQQRWGDSRCSPEGIYQLERTIGLDETGPDTDPPFDIRPYTRLTEGYIRTGQATKTRDTWTKLIEILKKHGPSPVPDILVTLFHPDADPIPLPDVITPPLEDPPFLPDFRRDRPRGCCPP